MRRTASAWPLAPASAQPQHPCVCSEPKRLLLLVLRRLRKHEPVASITIALSGETAARYETGTVVGFIGRSACLAHHSDGETRVTLQGRQARQTGRPRKMEE